MAKILTVQGPWAWAIIHGPKRVENRTWRVNYRGPLYIHAGRSRAWDARAREILEGVGAAVPPGDELPRGVIVGVVDLVDCADYPDRPGRGRMLPAMDDDPYRLAGDPLADGPVCWILRNPRPLARPVPCLGHQGLWEADLAGLREPGE